jgi:hypothetical protein
MSDGCQNYDRGQLPPRSKSGGKPVTRISILIDDCTKHDRAQLVNVIKSIAARIEASPPTLMGGAFANVAWTASDERMI